MSYLDAGWPGIVPMTGATEKTAKGEPAKGVTGHHGVNLTRDQITDWLAGPDHWRWPNISLRADGWVGIDVDQYGAKRGAEVLDLLEKELGPLPATFISSARDLPSGIRIFRLPPGVVLEKLAEVNLAAFAKRHGHVDEAGAGQAHIDIIRRGHRYAKVWPTPHPNGDLYRWHLPSGAVYDGVPELDWCPELPAAWVAFLTQLGPNMEGVGHGDRGDLVARAGGSGDRVFTEAEAIDFMAPHLAVLRGARFNSGSFNSTLTAVASTVGHFAEMFGDDGVIGLLADAIRDGNRADPDAADMGTIRSGLSLAEDWQGRLPDEREQTNPFAAGGRYCTLPTRVATAWEMKTADTGMHSEVATGAGVPALDDDEDDVVAPVVTGAATTVEEPVPPVAGFVLPSGPLDPGAECYLPEEFWAARPIFAHLRRAAWAAMQSPEGVLTAAMAMTVARVMPNVKLPACIGTVSSLNLMGILIGDPGDGKSVCRKLAQQSLKFPSEAMPDFQFNPSSGQGVAFQYTERVKERGKPGRQQRKRWGALAMVEESDKLAELEKNPSNTLNSTLRAAAMGENIGNANAGETQTEMGELAYAFAMLMCMQTELGGWLLGSSAGGLPQRFLWACVRDPRVVEGIEKPGIFEVNMPMEVMPDWTKQEENPFDATKPVPGIRLERVMDIADGPCREIWTAAAMRKQQGRKASVDLDGHALLVRLKVAGVFAILDGRTNITDEDWGLASQYVTASQATLAWIRNQVALAGTRDADKAAKSRGRARLVEATGEAEATSKFEDQVQDDVVRYVTEAGVEGITFGALFDRKPMRKVPVQMRREVVERLVERGRLVTATTAASASGTTSQRLFLGAPE